MGGNVWASPLGDRLVTRGGDVFTAGDDYATDMIYISALAAGWITALAWDVPGNEIVTAEGSHIRTYELSSYTLIDSEALSSAALFVGKFDGAIYAVLPQDASTQIEVLRDNEPPVAVAFTSTPEIECQGPSGTLVTLDGGASTDPDSTPGTNDDIVSFEWFEDFGMPDKELLGIGEILDVALSLGAHPVTLRVTDSVGETDTDEISVNVIDTLPPEISVVLEPNVLWPPNHRLIDTQATVVATDVCGTTAVLLLSVESSEPDDGEGDGSTGNDIQGAEPGSADHEFMLRAERAGGGTGRIYTAVYAATDASGNTAEAAGYSFVPHDQGGSTDPVDLSVDPSPAGTVVRWTDVAGAGSYDVIRGELAAIDWTENRIDLGSVTYIVAGTTTITTEGHEDAAKPLPGSGFFYLVQYFDGRSSSFGSDSAPKPREPGLGTPAP